MNLKTLADELKKKLQQGGQIAGNAWNGYINNVAKPAAIGVPQAQQAIKPITTSVANYFNPQDQNKYVNSFFNYTSNIPRFQLPQRLPGNMLPTNTNSKATNFVSGLVRSGIESPLNIPRNLIVGSSRLQQEQLNLLRNKKYNLANAISGAGNLVEAGLDLSSLGIVKGIGRQAIVNTAKEGAWNAIKQGVKQGALAGAVGGGAYGVGNQYNKKFNVGEVALNTAGGALLGGVLGGTISGIGSIKRQTTYSPQLAEQLRDARGRWVAGQTPIKPPEMPKSQWKFQLKANAELGRNPYEPVYSSDLQEIIKNKGGLSVKKLTKFEHEQNVAKDAKAGLYDTNELLGKYGDAKHEFLTRASEVGQKYKTDAEIPAKVKNELKILENKMDSSFEEYKSAVNQKINQEATGLNSNQMQNNLQKKQGKIKSPSKSIIQQTKPQQEVGVRVIQPNKDIITNPSSVAQQPIGDVKASQAKNTQLQTIKGLVSPPKAEPEVMQIRTGPNTPIQEATLKQSKVPGSKALPDIISREPIDVKSKVGLLDYLRTPDRVLKKIGMEKESNLIRQKYDDYLKQLPEEINKVTEWSKQVPASSNQKIFKFLDGQPTDLSPKEMKVAGEIKTYLSDWADKLGLPKEKRITNYITHIFEKDFIKKEFDPDIAKLIQDRVAGSVYDPFTEQRLGKMGYVEDTWRALDAYVKRATRKVNMDVALEQVKNVAKNLEDSQYQYVKSYIDRINLRPTSIDNLVDNTIKQMVGYRFGQRPVASLSRFGRQMVYRGTLGLNPGSALKNLSQGANTYAKLGERYTIKGYLDTLIKGTKELEDVGVLRDNFIQDRTISAGKQIMQKVDKGLFVFFDAAEKINRGAAYYGAKARALAKGLNEQEAIQEGLKTVRDTQFTFGSIDTPPILSSDLSKLLLQFQSYSLKQGEFLGEMIQKKEFAGLVRYALAGSAFVYSLGQLIGMKPKDLIPSIRLGLPPTLQAPIEIGKAIIGSPDEYGNKPTPKERLTNAGESLIPFIPAGTQIKKTVQGLTDVDKGYSESASGRVRYPVQQTTGNYIRGGLFGRHNLPEAQEYYNKDRSVLGEEQSNLIKSSIDKFGDYSKIIKTRESKAIENKADEAFLAGDTTQQKTGNIYRYIDDTGNVKKIDLSFPLKEYTPTGNDTLDKELLADYKGSITTAKNNVMKAWEVGAITQEQAITELEKLVIKANKTKKPKKSKLTFKITKSKPATINIKRRAAPKLATIKFKKPKIKKSIIRRYTIR